MQNGSDPSVTSEAESEKLPSSLWGRFRSHFRMRPADDDEPQDWWVASTAIPLVAATAGPLANVMSINALVTPWRNNILSTEDADGQLEQVGFHDPHWCIALNATSLACGLAGNIFLLFTFTRAVRYIYGVPLSIILWLISTGILAAVTAGIYIYAPPIPPHQIFSQGYWSAVIAAVLYFVLCIILMINMLGYFLGHYPQCFALSDEQRTLILQTMAFFIWLTIGAAVFHRVMDISFADALYFSDVTILTLGFGDIPPPNNVSKGLVFPFAVFGIITLGLVVGSIHKFAEEMSYDNIVKAHFQRRRKDVVAKSVTIERESDDDMENGEIRRSLSRTESLKYGRRKLDSSYEKKWRKRPIRTAIGAIGRAAINRPKVLIMKEEKDRFDTMRAIQSETLRFRRWFTLFMSVMAFALVWAGGAVVFWALEPIGYFDALYFGFCCLLTIGYGDITPKSNPGRPFFIVWSLIAVPTMTILISEMSDTVVVGFKRVTNSLGEWTFLPSSEKYMEFIGKHPPLKKLFRGAEEKRRIARGFQVGLDVPLDSEGNPVTDHPAPTIEKLAKEPPPSNLTLARDLAFAIRRTADDLSSGKVKRYNYEEWVEFTRLIRFTDTNPPDVASVERDEDVYGIIDWDWIGENSPMLAEQTEPEWVLDRLCESLIRYLDLDKTTVQEEEEEETRTVLRKEEDIGIRDNGGDSGENGGGDEGDNNRSEGVDEAQQTSSISTPDDLRNDPSLRHIAIDQASRRRSRSSRAAERSRPSSPKRSRSPSSRFRPTPRRGPFRILPDGAQAGRASSGDRRISSETRSTDGGEHH